MVKVTLKKEVVQVSGKRKSAVARVTIKPGKGKVQINSKLLELCGPEISRLRIYEPIMIAGDVAKKLDIDVNVTGGGWSAQSEATRLAIARGLVEFTKDEDLKKKYLMYDRHLLVADTRYKEQKKPGTHSHARQRRQKSYR